MAKPAYISSNYIKDEDVCELLAISQDTLLRWLREGPPRAKKKNVLDLRKVKHVYIGKVRLWRQGSLMAALGEK